MKIILASKSPRRRGLFSIITEQFATVETNVDEGIFSSLPAKEQSEGLAKLKCRTAFAKFPDAVVIGCDTLVESDGEVFGKPIDRNDAFRMLRRLSNATHNVYTGVAIASPEFFCCFSCCTEVFFREMSNDEINAYIDSGEPFDKAGGYGIQGMAARYIRGVSGDYFNVMGLPVSMIYGILHENGIV